MYFQLDRRAQLALLVAALVTANAGCGGGGGPASHGDPCHDVQGSVSAVNGWPGIDPKKYAAELAGNCQKLVEIEGFPWVDRSGPCDAAHPNLCSNPFRPERQAFLRAMAARGITVLVTLQNANAESVRLMTDDVYRQHVRDLREDAGAVGLEHVWLGPLSEPWAWEDRARAYSRTLTARQEWDGVFVLPDAGGNRPTGRPYFSLPYDYLEVHPCSIADAYTSLRSGPQTLTVTDCYPVLNPGPGHSTDLALEAFRLDRPFVIYDHLATEPDLETIGAIGAALKY